MKESIFWQLLGEITSMSSFIAAVPNGAASANIVGRLRPGYDGGERVIEKEVCHCHIHLKPDQVATFSFTYLDVGFGAEPCVELLDAGGQPIIKLYYQGRGAAKQFQEFINRHAEHRNIISGSW